MSRRSNKGELAPDVYGDDLCVSKCVGRYKTQKQNETPWPESASELHLPSDLRLSAKLVPSFEDRRVSHSRRGGCVRGYVQLK
jgi:hypothetical protein